MYIYIYIYMPGADAGVAGCFVVLSVLLSPVFFVVMLGRVLGYGAVLCCCLLCFFVCACAGVGAGVWVMGGCFVSVCVVVCVVFFCICWGGGAVRCWVRCFI